MTELEKPLVIAIDGPAASGKSTLGELVAKWLGFFYFDTGVTNQAYPEAVYYSPSWWTGYLIVWQDQLSGQMTYDIHGRSMAIKSYHLMPSFAR